MEMSESTLERIDSNQEKNQMKPKMKQNQHTFKLKNKITLDFKT